VADIVGSVPEMDPEGFQAFRECLANSRCYLEYGCGASTVYAFDVARVGSVISVESDREWAQKVVTSLGTASDSPSRLLIAHCDIGEVGQWGAPVSNERVNDYWQYMCMPWNIASKHGLVPDTILVDGRFRVASFLYSLLAAREGATLLFDDYLTRPQYSAVERYCRLRERRGRMGVFTVAKDYPVVDLCERIAQYSIVWE